MMDYSVTSSTSGWTSASDVSNASLPVPSSGGNRREPLTSEALEQIVVLSVFMLIALIGNVSVLIYLVRTDGGQRPVSIFVMALAFTDILIALFSMSTEILFEAFGGEWLFGNAGCKLVTYVQGMLFGSTAFIMMGMSYDRYEAICKPMFLSRTLSRSRHMIIAAWVVAGILAVPQIFVFLQVSYKNHLDGSPKYECRSKGYTAEWQRMVYLTWLATYIFLIPVAFVAYCYIRIALVVWRNSLKPSYKPAACGKSTNGHVNDVKSTQMTIRRSTAADEQAERAKNKTIKLTVCIISCYIACWTPYFAIILFNAWTNYQLKHLLPSFLASVSKCMCWFSSCVNPLIYMAFNISLNSLGAACCGKTMPSTRLKPTESPRPSTTIATTLPPTTSRRNTTVSLSMAPSSNNRKESKHLTSLTQDVKPVDSSVIKTSYGLEALEGDYDPRTLLVMI